MRLMQTIGKWLDDRLQVGATLRETAEHPVPRETASWFYVFRQRGLCRILAANCHGHHAGAHLRAFRR